MLWPLKSELQRCILPWLRDRVLIMFDIYDSDDTSQHSDKTVRSNCRLFLVSKSL